MSDPVAMDYEHPEWSPRAMKVAASASLLLKRLQGVDLPPLAEKEAERLRERLTLLHEVSCGGEPDFIQKALKRFAHQEGLA